jgi:transposase-like protein
MVASAIRPAFEQPDEQSARGQLDRVIDGMAGAYPKVAVLLADAEADLLSHFAFPESHRSRIRSANPLERLNKEIPVLEWSKPEGPPRPVVGIFPNRASVIRIVGMILAEQDEEGRDGRCCFRPESMALIDALVPIEEVGQPLMLAS